jgi:DHA2 family methylenomycin A resistance protein-like MFS transporter
MTMTGLRTPRGRTVGFAAICLAYFMIILDGSVLNVAVPAIRRGLGASMAEVQWALNGYTLALAALLLTAGALGDRVGLRRGLLGGVLLFTGASALCASAPDIGLLIAARVVQGVGAAALLPATLALVPYLFHDAVERAKAAVIWVATGSAAVAAGPLAGGLLIDTFGWRSVFVINLPVGVVSAVLVRRYVRETPTHAARVDYPGQFLVAATLALVTAGLIFGGAQGWTAPVTLATLAGGVLTGALFWLVESRSAHPMLPPALFADRVRAAAVASAGLMGFLFYGTLFVMSLCFQQLHGWSAGLSGVGLLPLTVGSTIGPLVLYRPLAARFGHRVLLVAGFSCALAGVVTLLGVGSGRAYLPIAAGLLLVGGASTIAFSALTSLLLTSLPTHQSGLGSGVQNTTRQSGALLAVSVLGSVLGAATTAGQLHTALTVLVVANLVALAVSVAGLRAKAPA